MTQFRVTYDGPALRGSEMDVRELAPALLAIADLLKSANRVLHGDRADVRVHVRGSFKTGSFGIDLTVATDMLKLARDIFSGPEVGAVLNAAGVVSLLGLCGGGLLAVLRKLRGRKPDRIETTDSGVTFHVEQEAIHVEQNVYLLFADPATRENLDGLLRPLDSEGIEEVAFSADGEVAEVITQDEREWFEPSDPVEEMLFETTLRTILAIESAVFREGNKWRFSDGTATFHAEILDVDFLARIETGEERFGKGDQLIVDLRRSQLQADGKLRTDYAVVKVIEHRAPPQKRLVP